MAKKIVSRGGQKILGALASGTGDPMLTKDTATKEVGEVPAIDSSNFLTTSLLSGYLIVGSNLNIATPRQITGDVLISNLGVTSISPNTIVNSQVNAAAGISYSKLNLTNGIVNNDINASAAIARTKIANGNVNRILINNGSGVFSDNAAITANRVLISDASGLPTHSTVTTTTLGYLDATSSIQTQLNNKLSFSSAITPAEGDIIYYTGGAWNRLAIGTSGQVLLSNGTIPTWGTPLANGIPTGGTASQVLRKIDGTNYNTEWHTVVTADITDLTATAANINILAGTTVTAVQFNYLTGATSNLQTQISSKLDNSLAHNNIFVGNISGQAGSLAPGTDGHVLTLVSGSPQWQAPTGGGSVSSVSGTAGRITSTGGANPIINIDPAYVGQATIDTVGTITTGTWNGNAIGATYGGTGQTVYTVGDILYASTTTALSKLAAGTATYVLTSNGAGVAPSWEPAGGAGGAWLLASGGTFTGDNTILTDGFRLDISSVADGGMTGDWYANVWNINGYNSGSQIAINQGTTVGDGFITLLTNNYQTGVKLGWDGSRNGVGIYTDGPVEQMFFDSTGTIEAFNFVSFTLGDGGATSQDFDVSTRTYGLTGTNGADYTQVLGTATALELDAATTGQNVSILLSTTAGQFKIEDSRTVATGIEYSTDYSANYTNRSLVDKEYVDGVAGGGASWLLASGGTLTGTNTITSNAANRLNFTGTWSASASNQYHTQFGSTITTRTGFGSDVTNAYLFNPAFVGGSPSNTAYGVNIAPTYTGTFSGNNKVSLRVRGDNGTILRLSQNGYADYDFATGAVLSGDTGDLEINTSSNYGYVFSTNSIKNFTINKDGLVAIGANGVATANTRLDIRGTGLTSSTSAIRVADSNNVVYALFRDDGYLNLGSGTGVFLAPVDTNPFNPNKTGRGLSISVNGLSLNNTPITTIWQAADNDSSGNKTTLRLYNVTLNPTSGTVVYRNLLIDPTYNTTGTYSGTIYGIDYNPTLTSLTGATHIAFRSTSGVSVFGAGSSDSITTGVQRTMINSYNGSTLIPGIYLRNAANEGSVALALTTDFLNPVSTGRTLLHYAFNNYNLANKWNHVFAASNTEGGVTSQVTRHFGSAAASINLTNTGSTSFTYKWLSSEISVNTTAGDTTMIGYNWEPQITGSTGLTNIAFRAVTGSVLIGGTSITASTRLQVRGTGTTTNTLILLEDSSGVEKFKMTDGGTITHNGVAAVSGYLFNTSGSIYTASNLRFDNQLRDNRDNQIMSQSASGVVSNRLLTLGNTSYSILDIILAGQVRISQAALSASATPVGFNYIGGAHTNLTASVEAYDVYYDLGRIVQFATGTLATQRAFVIEGPSYSFVGASTLTKAVTFSITNAPISSTNATITTSIGFEVEASTVAGTGTVGTAYAAYFNTPTGATTNYGLGFTGKMHIVSVPTNDNAATDILVRDSSTGEVKYRTAASLSGGGGYTVTTVTTTTHNEASTSGEELIVVDAATAGGNVTVNLPTAVGNTAKFHIKKIDSGSNTVTIDGNGTETIDGNTTFTLNFQWESITLLSDNNNWYII